MLLEPVIAKRKFIIHKTIASVGYTDKKRFIKK